MTSELPPGLQAWAPSLGFLDVDTALHIGPLVRRLDALVRRVDATEAPEGEPDGFGGLSRRGDPERMLLSEWLLADEMPLEFMRRAASAELLHLRTVTRRPTGRGRVAVLADVGPDQLGAPRLVQLAALIVLHRRAAARGSELAIGLTSEPPGGWHTGELPELYEAWRRGHAPVPTAGEAFASWTAAADAEDELWVLTGQPVEAGSARLLTIQEAEWGEDGVTGVDVRLRQQRVRLPVPAGKISVRALRGQALRRQGGPARAAAPIGSFSWPLFPSSDRRLVMRGERPEEIVVVTLPQDRTRSGKLRRHRLDAPVVAAASIGRRLVALVRDGEHIRGRTIGKELGYVAQTAFEADAVGLGVPDPGQPDRLEPLLYDRGALLCRLDGQWWRIAFDEEPQALDLITAGPTPVRDLARTVRLGGEHLFDGSTIIGYGVHRGSVRAVAATHGVAWSQDRRWYIRGEGLRPSCVHVDEDRDVLGLWTLGREDDPALVTRSRAGMILRVETESSSTTLTRWSGIAIAHAVHPGQPLLAVQRDEDLVEIADLRDGELLMTVRAAE